MFDLGISFGTVLIIALAIVGIMTLFAGIKQVSQNEEYIVERFGRFHSKLTAGLNFLVPFIDRVAYKFSLKEYAIDVPSQAGITKDNVTLQIDGVLFMQIVDSKAAAYGVASAEMAVVQLAQTSMRAKIGEMQMDEALSQREAINGAVRDAVNAAAASWGILCKRYEIRTIDPPTAITQAMEKQATAEREKRAAILRSEGERDAAINRATGEKERVKLESEAAQIQQVNEAKGQAEAIIAVAEANAKSVTIAAEAQATALNTVGKAASSEEGRAAVQFDLAGRALDVQAAVAKESTVIIRDGDKAGNTAGTVAEALAVATALAASGHTGAATAPKAAASK